MQIEIDFEVYKRLTLERVSEKDSYNSALRRLLGLSDPEAASHPSSNGADKKGWSPKGVFFPEGTELRATLGGVLHTGRVSDGALIVGGKRFSSPSAAGVGVANYSVNGWTFWECKLPEDHHWVTLDAVRRRQQR